MAKRAKRIRNPELAGVLRSALGRGELKLAQAIRVMRALEGSSQQQLAERAGIDVKVIKAIEAGRGNPNFASLDKIAAVANLRVAFVDHSSIELMEPRARADEERQSRYEDAKALASGQVSERKLHERNALRVDELSFDLPSFA